MNTLSLNNFKEITSPLSQFEIRDLLSIDAPILNNLHISLTNIVEYLIVSFVIIIMFNAMTNKSVKIVYPYWNLSKECINDTIYSIVINQINKYSGQIYFPFIFTLFLFILTNNLIGMVPYSFSPTSHFILTFSISFSVVIGSTFLGLKDHNIKFFSLFVPAGCPLPLLPIILLLLILNVLKIIIKIKPIVK